MIIDAFCFNDEFDMLDFRLAELNDYVDLFVITEAKYTWTADPKPLNLKENIGRYKKYADKIVFSEYEIPWLQINKNVKDDELIHLNLLESHWNEKESKIELRRLLREVSSDDDIIFHSDLDEIWNTNILDKIDFSNLPAKVAMDWYVYDLEHIIWEKNLNQQWATDSISVLNGKHLKKVEFRSLRGSTDFPVIKNGAWHFTWFGNEDWISKKFETGMSKDWFRTPLKIARADAMHRHRYKVKEIPANLKHDPNKSFEVRFLPLKENNNLPKNYKMLIRNE